VRAVPNMIKISEELSGYSKKELEDVLASYDNRKSLAQSVEIIRDYLTEIAEKILRGE
jgi:phosphopantothenate synthetase